MTVIIDHGTFIGLLNMPARLLIMSGTPAQNGRALRSLRAVYTNGDPSIRGISILLKTPLKGAPKDAASPVKRKGHGITRGAEQFREGGDLK